LGKGGAGVGDAVAVTTLANVEFALSTRFELRFFLGTN
jgi:hypothetical protein